MQTSFKKSVKVSGGDHRISGTQRSIHNGQMLCSTGVPSLDSVFGGGIPVGSVLMVEEDSNDQYANLLTRYFVAEGVVCGNAIITVSSESIESQVNRLPEPIFSSAGPAYLSRERMKIAWRYQSMPQVDASYGHPLDYGHNFDINQAMNPSRLRNCDYNSINLKEEYNECNAEEAELPKKVVKKLQRHMHSNHFTIDPMSTGQSSKVLRVVIPNFGSPLWGTMDRSTVVQFLFCLRKLLRNSLTVCILSVPTQTYPEDIVQLMRHHVDTVVELKDFGSDKTNPLYKEYHGLLKVHKLPIINTLLPYMPDTLDLAFKLRRKKFSIERLHLPPDIGTSQQEKGSTDNNTTPSIHNTRIDF